MKYLSLWQLIRDEIKDVEHDNIVGVFHLVVNHSGSSPGKQGFKMLVLNANEFQLHSSIGGGIMEHKIIEKSKEKIRNNISEITIQELLHHEGSGTGEKSGLFCSGMQTVVSIPFNRSVFDLVNKIIHSYSDNKPFYLQITHKGIELKDNKPEFSSKYNFEGPIADNWVYQEKIGKSAFNLVYVFGGGHVGAALTRQLSLLDYHITVCDNRTDLIQVQENKYAHEIKIQSYKQSVAGIVSDIENEKLDASNISIVIVTAAFGTDYEVLSHLMENLDIERYPKYIGLMGSTTKISKICDRLRNEGDPDHDFSNFIGSIYAPIGLEINSGSVEEIAVSIAAQIIKVNNEE